MAHMWGARLQNWGPEMPEELWRKVAPNEDLLYMSDNLKNCATYCSRDEVGHCCV
jgi:hypothetical protein